MWYGYAADLVVGIHLAYVAYVLIGQLLITIAAPFKWQWARNPWFRFSHLGMIAFVVFEEIIAMRCPLTVWEEHLRDLAGEAYRGGTFMGRLLHSVLFIDGHEPIWYTTIYVAMFIIVVQGVLMYPPRLWRGKRNEPVAAANPNPTPALVA